MELTSFIKNNNITDFNNLKQTLENEPFYLGIKEDNDFNPNLFLIHTTNKSDINIKLVRECNGIILEKNTFKICCYNFDKCFDNDDEITPNINFNYDNLYVESAIEGTLIRLYFYNNTWNVSTKKCLDATKSKWLSSRNFSELFYEVLSNNGVNLNEFCATLNTNYCYSFVLAHVENKMVVNYYENNLYHISTRDLNTLNEIFININIKQIEKVKLEKDVINDVLNSINETNTLQHEGFIFIDENYNRHKIRTPIFKKARELLGNTNNRFQRYLELRKDVNLFSTYLEVFPNDRELFVNYEATIDQLTTTILNYYYSKHINKNNVHIPYCFAKVIYNLHGDFIKTKIFTDFNKIKLYLIDLAPNKVIFMKTHYDKFLFNEQQKLLNPDITEAMMEE